MNETGLTEEQKVRIYCVKNGHAKYVDSFFGEVYCGRCGDKIGDTLAGVFPIGERAMPSCKKSPCKHCDPIIESLDPLDKQIWDNWKKLYAQDPESDDYIWPTAEKAREGVSFPA